MKRRDFITLLGGAAATWSLAARAQQPGKVPTIGYLGGSINQRAWVDTFVQRLRELGWIEGRTVAIEFRWGDGRSERSDEIAAEFARLKVDVIVTDEPHQSSRQNTRRRSFPSFLLRPGTRSAAALSPAWRDRAATSPAWFSSASALPANPEIATITTLHASSGNPG